MFRIKLTFWLFKTLFPIRVWLIKFLAGRLSVALNVSVDSCMAISSGLVHNVHFMRRDQFVETFSESYSARLFRVPGSIVIETDCVYDNRQLYVRPGGNDENDGLSSGTAKRTIAAVEKVVQPGDVVYVGHGTEGPLLASKSGSA